MAFITASGQGWGLAYDGEHLIGSDGSAVVVFWKLPTLSSKSTQEVSRITVHHKGGSQQVNVNELEFVDGYLYANIW